MLQKRKELSISSSFASWDVRPCTAQPDTQSALSAAIALANPSNRATRSTSALLHRPMLQVKPSLARLGWHSQPARLGPSGRLGRLGRPRAPRAQPFRNLGPPDHGKGSAELGKGHVGIGQRGEVVFAG
jgi:hypothetical protein